MRTGYTFEVCPEEDPPQRTLRHTFYGRAPGAAGGRRRSPPRRAGRGQGIDVPGGSPPTRRLHARDPQAASPQDELFSWAADNTHLREPGPLPRRPPSPLVGPRSCSLPTARPTYPRREGKLDGKTTKDRSARVSFHACVQGRRALPRGRTPAGSLARQPMTGCSSRRLKKNEIRVCFFPTQNKENKIE